MSTAVRTQDGNRTSVFVSLLCTYTLTLCLGYRVAELPAAYSVVRTKCTETTYIPLRVLSFTQIYSDRRTSCTAGAAGWVAGLCS